MSLTKAVAELFSSDKKEEVGHASWTGSRLWMLVAFVALVLIVTKGVLTEHNMKLLFWAFAVYTVTNTVTRTAQIIMNGIIVRERQALAWKDGALSAEEERSLGALDAKARADAGTAAVAKP